MDEIFQELGIPTKYVRNTCRDNRYVALVHRIWLKSLIKHSKLTDFIEKSNFESWPHSDEPVGQSWLKIMLQVFKKKEDKVLPLPRMRATPKDEPPLTFCQLLQYISQTNYKNLWKESYKKYSSEAEATKDIQVVLADYNEVLLEVIARIYGCPIISLCAENESSECLKRFEVHLNVLPAICAVETPNAIFLLHIPCLEHTLNDCVTFSPSVLEKCYTKPLFIVYQLLQTLKTLHDRSVTLGDVTLSDIYINDDLWIETFPRLTSNVYVKETPKSDLKVKKSANCRETGHKINAATLKCDSCGAKTYDRCRLGNDESLERLCQLWVEGEISNFTYLTVLNNLAGRKVGDPNCHHVFPWVSDFASRCGKNWRDLRKSKYRLNKGDRQLDLQYDSTCQTKVPHHVSDVLSAITYYVYMARRTPKSVLRRHVRAVWVPAEYPGSVQRLQEWSPDECIPEFFGDASVFRSVHEDLGDLEVPHWCGGGPEEFVEWHRGVLESAHVSERLHHWIDLTFGYKLTGHAAVKSKNVCLHLVDDHEHLTKSGIVQLFTQPHPPRASNSIFWSKIPPKILMQKTTKHKTRDRSHSTASSGGCGDNNSTRSDEEEVAQTSTRSSLVLSNFLSRSRNCLNEDAQKVRSSSQRSSSLGPKTPTFTSHVTTPKSKTSQLSAVPSNGSNATATIFLPKEYKPEAVLESLEKLHGFFSKTFYIEEGRKLGEVVVDGEETEVQNAFTNRFFTETFEKGLRKKSNTFIPGGENVGFCVRRQENQITCNYTEIVAARCTRELQVLGCLLVEIFMNKQLRTLGWSNVNKVAFKQRLKACITVVKTCQNDIPPCIKHLVNLLLTPEDCLSDNFKYPCITELGLPPPSTHLMLEPLLHAIIPFSPHFSTLWTLIASSKGFEAVTEELNVLYHQECNGEACNDYESMERTKLLLTQNIGECKVKLCARNLELLMRDLSTVTHAQIVNILLPHVKNLIEEPSTSVLAAWYLFDPMAKLLGPADTSEKLLQPIVKLYENEFNETAAFYNNKIVKLYHHHFLLCLIVRLGLKCFLENFITPLVEAVGGYRDYEQVNFVFHTHTTKIVRKTSNLKSMAREQNDISLSDDSSTDSEKNTTKTSVKKAADSKPEEVFEFEEEDQMKSLIAHLELNVESELPFDHSTAEEALDATLSENIDQLRNLEELNLNIDDVSDLNYTAPMTSPTIPIPTNKPDEVYNISCDVGSKKSDKSECFVDQHSNPSHFDVDLESVAAASSASFSARKSDAKISDMSADSLIWLAHRLGPVLTARFLTRNLLKMLTLCYVGRENLTIDNNQNGDLISIASSSVTGDQNALKVLECLSNIAALYGEQLILVQYLPHMSELISLCKRRLTQNLEGGLIACLALLKYIVPFISDSALMDQLQDVILRNILNPIVRLLGSTKYIFPNGATARNVIARKYLDTVYLLTLRIGADMTRMHLAVPALQRFFLIFDKITLDPDSVNPEHWSQKEDQLAKSFEDSHFVELRRDGTTSEWAIGGRPVQISHVRIKDSIDSLSPPPPFRQTAESLEKNHIINQALEELKAVFTAELAHQAYVPFLKQIGASAMETSLKNHAHLQLLCQEHDELIKGSSIPDWSLTSKETMNVSTSIGSNIALIGNRIDVQSEDEDSPASNVLKLVSNRMENESRHLRGNWLAYWEHEIGRADKDVRFNFKQIKLQTFAGHTHSVKSLYVLDNENSFMSGSRDKTVKLWSLRSQGDGGAVSSCQWTYTAHRKSILAITFIESLRLAASCDGVVHVWDPFLGVNVCSLEAARYAPVNVLKCMPAPSTQMFAGTTEGTVKVVDGRLCSYVHELKITYAPGGLIRCIAVAPSGNWMATGQSSGQITVLDTRTGLVVSTWCAHEGEVLQLVAVNENTLISSSLDQTVAVWNVHDGKFKFNMRGASEPVHCLNIYNSELISGTTANRIGVHTSIDGDASFSSTKLRADAFKGLLTSMAILPLNRLLLLGADNGNVVLLC